MAVFNFIKTLFGANKAKLSETAMSTFDSVVKTVTEQPKMTNPSETLGAGLKKLRETFGTCIEAKPGFRRFRLNTVDGPVDTVLTSKTTDSFVGSLGHPGLSNSTLTISRDVGADANSSLRNFMSEKNGFWNRIKLDPKTKQPIQEFLGLRRDYVWGKDGLKKITSVQESTTTIPYGTSRELRPQFESKAYREGWLPTTEYPQKCPDTVKTTVINKKPSTQPTIYRDKTEDVLREHKDTTRLYDGPKYIDKYSDYRTPVWHPYR